MLEDVNDEIPLFTEREQETVLEGEPIGTKVTQVNAIDKDGTFPNNRVSSLSLIFWPCTAVILLKGFTSSLSYPTRRFLYSQCTKQIDRYTSEVNSRSIFSIYTVFEDLAIKINLNTRESRSKIGFTTDLNIFSEPLLLCYLIGRYIGNDFRY